MAGFIYSRGVRLLALITLSVLAQTRTLRAQDTALNPVLRNEPSASAPIEIAALADAPSELARTARPAGEPLATAYAPAVPPMPVMAVTAVPEARPHDFWDRENCLLFAGVATLATADFFVTRSNLASGGRELNPVTRVLSGSTPGLAANFALETGAVMGVTYLFHKTGHHKLERFTSLVNMSGSAGAVAYGLTHR